VQSISKTYSVLHELVRPLFMGKVTSRKGRLLKLLVGIIIVAFAIGILVIDEQNKQSQEKAAFEQLSAAYQEMPNYPNAQNIWRGARQEKLADDGVLSRYAVVRISTFTTPDSKDQVLSFYKEALESTGWHRDDDGHGGHVSLTCHSFLDGNFYVNPQNEYVWIAEYNAGIEYRIYKVTGTFWMYGDCF
jgi:hypothetical protein